jgi:hypothetical protein
MITDDLVMALKQLKLEIDCFEMALVQNLPENPVSAPGHLQIIAYFQRAGRRPPHKRQRGRYAWYEHWIRNLGICFLILLTCAEYGVDPTRNRESRRAKRQASGISLVTAALALNRMHFAEGTIQQKIWLGLPGELARRVAAERPIETWFRSVSP